MNKNIVPTINRKQLQQAIKVAIKTQQNIMVVGSPGCGKTQITEQTAKQLTPYTYTATPAVEDPTVPLGMPIKTEDNQVFFAPFKLMKQLINHNPDAEPFVVILDDFGQAPPATQAGYMQVYCKRQ